MKQSGRFILAICVIAVVASWPFGQCRGEAGSKYKRTIENPTVPDVVLINQNGARVPLKTMMNSDKPVLMDFVFTTCTTICPVMSAGFSNLQRRLGPDAGKAHLVSISIDPENDMPGKMKEYLRRFDARPGWDFLTGSRKDIDQVLNAFGVFALNKMSHRPIVFVWSPVKKNWSRLDGLMSTAELIGEFKTAASK